MKQFLTAAIVSAFFMVAVTFLFSTVTATAHPDSNPDKVSEYAPATPCGNSGEPDNNGDCHSNCHTGNFGNGAGGNDKGDGCQTNTPTPAPSSTPFPPTPTPSVPPSETPTSFNPTSTATPMATASDTPTAVTTPPAVPTPTAPAPIVLLTVPPPSQRFSTATTTTNVRLPNTGTGPILDVTFTSREFFGFLGIEAGVLALIGALALVGAVIFVTGINNRK